MRAIFSRLGLLSLLLATGFAFAPSAQAAGDSSGWIGANVGMSVPNADNSTARPIMGVNGGAMLGTEFGLGAYYLTSSKDETANGATSTFAYSFYGVDFTYHFEGEAAGAYFGGRLGMSRVSAKSGGVEIAINPMHYGIVGGYDHKLSESFSLGGEVSYLSVQSGSTTVLGVSEEVKAFSTLNFLVAAKFWF